MYNTPYPTQPPTTTQAPPPSYPPAGPPSPARSSWPRLAVLIAAIIVAASFLPATLPKSASAARKAAYPQPVIAAVVSNVGGSNTFHTGDQISFTVQVQAGKNLTYAWNINGQSYTGATVTTSFTDPGQQTASVTATDPIGQTANAQTSVTVLPPAPTACFNATQDSYFTSYYSFDASCSQGEIQQYFWDFGDGNVDNNSGSFVYHDYAANGTYTVTLTVVDGYNQRSTPYTQTVTVSGL